MPQYSRADWKHWIDSDGDCQNTRAEVLIEESNASPVFATDRRCRVVGGSWNGPYTGQTFTDASDLDIDHLVPLKNAHLSGGWRWDAERKEDYANSVAADYHLIAVEKYANRGKGAKAPDEWQPPDPSYHCQYAQDWIRVKAAWGLSAHRSRISGPGSHAGYLPLYRSVFVPRPGWRALPRAFRYPSGVQDYFVSNSHADGGTLCGFPGHYRDYARSVGGKRRGGGVV